MSNDSIALLTIDTDLGRIAARRLAARFPQLQIVVEERVPRLTLLRGRIRRLGLVRALGQLAFMVVSRGLIAASRRRIDELIQHFTFDPHWPDGVARIDVPSVNSSECVAHLTRLDPKVVLVLGTRIISSKALTTVGVPFINYHAGITPKYRGIHGGYWAKAQGDPANFGVTVHLVDAGIDTGAVLYQSRQTPEPQDNYATFPYLQLAAGLPLLELAAQDALDDKLTPKTIDMPSQIWSHPTLWEYVWYGRQSGAWGDAGVSILKFVAPVEIWIRDTGSLFSVASPGAFFLIAVGAEICSTIGAGNGGRLGGVDRRSLSQTQEL